MNIARRHLRSDLDAEECVNDVMLKLWQSIPPAEPRSLEAFIVTVTQRTAMKMAERIQAQKRGGGQAAASLDEIAEAVPAKNTVEDALSGIRPDGGQFNTDRSTLRADLNAGKVSEYLEYFYSTDADALMNGCEGCTKDENGVFITAKDGEKFYTATEYNHKCSVMPGITHRIDCPPVENDQRKPDKMEFDDYDIYNSRRQILEGMGLNSFEWGKLVLGYPYEFDTWDIVGTETVNGRNCVHIKGKANDKFIFAEFVRDFDMYTDAKTGVIVKLLGYNENGEISHFVNTLNLRFEDDAEPFEMPDFSDYEINEMSDSVYEAQGDAPVEAAPEPTEPVTDTAS